MPPVRTVSILGAGAMGAAFASKFYELDSACVSFIAAGKRADQLADAGLVVNGKPYHIPVLRPEDKAPPSDLVIVALKHHQLADAIGDLRHRVADHTVIISVMNGLDSEDLIAGAYGRDKVLYTISVGIDAQRSGNVINYSKLGTLQFGEPDNSTLSPRVRELQAFFERAGVGYDTPVDMIRTLWWKFMINVGVNQASAVMRAPYGICQTNPHVQAVMEAAMREVIACATAAGVNLVEQDIAHWYTVLNTLHPEGRTSMLQDIEAGRETEVEVFAGKVVALGRTYGVPTPVNETLYHEIKALEQVPRR